jgi:predicted nuclease with TOPRIM domain
MPPELAESIGPVLAILGVGSMILVGMKLRYSHLRESRLGGGVKEERERLVEAVTSLRDEVRMLREEFGELYERVEFAERLLTRGRADGELGLPPEA